MDLNRPVKLKFPRYDDCDWCSSSSISKFEVTDFDGKHFGYFCSATCANNKIENEEFRNGEISELSSTLLPPHKRQCCKCHVVNFKEMICVECGQCEKCGHVNIFHSMGELNAN